MSSSDPRDPDPRNDPGDVQEEPSPATPETQATPPPAPAPANPGEPVVTNPAAPVSARPAVAPAAAAAPVAPVTPAARTAPAPVVPRAGAGSLAGRILLTLAGAAGLIVGAFLDYVRVPVSVVGTDLSAKVLWTTTGRTTKSFVLSVGFMMIVLGLLAVIGLAFRSGWLTRLAAVLAIAGFVLFAIMLQRSPATTLPDSIGIGAWLGLTGAIVALIGGFLGTRHRVAVEPAVPGTVVETA